MQKRKLGTTDLNLSAIGLGTWAIGGGNWYWGWGPQDDAESIATIQRAIDLGINWMDSAAAYGLGYSEELIGKAIAGRRDEVIIATKCGLVWDDDTIGDGAQRRTVLFKRVGDLVHRVVELAQPLDQSARGGLLRLGLRSARGADEKLRGRITAKLMAQHPKGAFGVAELVGNFLRRIARDEVAAQPPRTGVAWGARVQGRSVRSPLDSLVLLMACIHTATYSMLCQAPPVTTTPCIAGTLI